MSKGTIYIFCGKMASGKSTLAAQISQQNALTLISEDALLGTLYQDQVVDVSTYVQFSGKIKLAIKPILVDLLKNGTSIVLDFPANTVDQRKWIRDIVLQAGAHAEFHYLNVPDSICKARLRQRAVKEPERHATDTLDMFDAVTRFFEPPSNDEGFEIINHQ
ncbi:MAG: AAA family ATPase [Granulosicoccus sp.]